MIILHGCRRIGLEASQVKARQGTHTPHPKIWREKLVKIERIDKKNQTKKIKISLINVLLQS